MVDVAATIRMRLNPENAFIDAIVYLASALHADDEDETCAYLRRAYEFGEMTRRHPVYRKAFKAVCRATLHYLFGQRDDEDDLMPTDEDKDPTEGMTLDQIEAAIRKRVAAAERMKAEHDRFVQLGIDRFGDEFVKLLESTPDRPADSD